MDTFKIISLTPAEHLAPQLKWLEARQIPYNVELSNVKQPSVKRTNGSSNKSLVLELLSQKPMTIAEIGEAFVAAGRTKKASYGPVHQLKRDKLVSLKGGKYSINKGAVK